MNGSAEDDVPDRYSWPGVSAERLHSPNGNDGEHPRRRTIIEIQSPALSGKIAKAALQGEPMRVESDDVQIY